MGSKANKLLLRIILAPIMILSKARDFYVKRMLECGGRVGYNAVIIGGPAVSQSVYLPESCSVVISSEGGNQDEEFRQLLQSTMRESLNMNNRQRVELRRRTVEFSDMGRSYSVGLGKIGRIDEDKPCSFREVEDENSFAKSRSHALRRNVVNYC